ncbi:MAG: Iron-binding protein IscA [Myxococcota bacterium]|nr:Iron-binding protein IscA [Myxococcota bacterium]
MSAITLTDNAIRRVKTMLTENKKEGYGLRVGVKGGGCSGLSYFMDFENTAGPNDSVIEFDGVKVYVDKKSALYLTGTQLDFKEGLMGSGFKFENPNVSRSCGCGESFSV